MNDTINTNPASSTAIAGQPQVPATSDRNTPTHTAYQVRDFNGREGKRSSWTRIGSAWAHGDGQGFNIQVDALPLDGRITLRVVSDRKD